MGTMTPRLILGVALALCIAAPHVVAQSGGRPAYNLQSETTVTGMVQAVTETTDAYDLNGVALPGTRITLKVMAGTMDVRLGPTFFLEQQNLDIHPGSMVQVVGSRVKMNDSDVILAKKISFGRTAVDLRDATGAPRWRAGTS